MTKTDGVNALQHVVTWVKQNDQEREGGMNTLQHITWVDVGVGRVLSGLDCHGLCFLTRGQVLDHQHQTTCTCCTMSLTPSHSMPPRRSPHAIVPIAWQHSCMVPYHMVLVLLHLQFFSYAFIYFLLLPMWISLHMVGTTLKTQQKWSHEG